MFKSAHGFENPWADLKSMSRKNPRILKSMSSKKTMDFKIHEQVPYFVPGFPQAAPFCSGCWILPRNFNTQVRNKLLQITPSADNPVAHLLNFLKVVHRDAPPTMPLPPMAPSGTSASSLWAGRLELLSHSRTHANISGPTWVAFHFTGWAHMQKIWRIIKDVFYVNAR